MMVSKGKICPPPHLQYPRKGSILVVSKIPGRILRRYRDRRCTTQLAGIIGKIGKRVAAGSPGHTTSLASSRHGGTLLSLDVNSMPENGERGILILALKGRACVTFGRTQKMSLDKTVIGSSSLKSNMSDERRTAILSDLAAQAKARWHREIHKNLNYEHPR
jgi:hypothetical protein